MTNEFKDKRVLITGHTGFKGSWLSNWLTYLGAEVIGVSIDIPTSPSNFNISQIGNVVEDFRLDVRDAEEVKVLIEKIKPDFVFHLAAQALVRQSYKDPLGTITTNAIGTANILDALRDLDKKVIAIMITSDKAYDNVEWTWGYRENDRLGGKDPYSASKGMAELVIRSYVESYFKDFKSNVRVGITRAGNVIGGGDWASDRIVPDCMKAWSKANIVDIRSPTSTRPWQHVLEPLSGYLLLAKILMNDDKLHGEAYNFGPSADQNYPVSILIDEMSKHWNKVKWNDVSGNQDFMHESGLLKLNCDKALNDLGWQPTLFFKETVRFTVEWYKAYYQKNIENMNDFSIRQIKEFTSLANSRDIAWAKNDK